MVNLHTKPALMIIDMQNGFCHPEGSFAKLGLPTEGHMSVVPAIQRLREIFRKKGLPIFYTRMGFKEDYSDAGILLDIEFRSVSEVDGFVQGTWDTAIIDELTPDANNAKEIVVNKNRNTAFYGSSGDQLRRLIEEKGIDHLVCCGVATNVCVESTVRDAFTNGIYVSTVREACMSLDQQEHEAGLRSLKWFGGVTGIGEVEEALQALK